MTVAAVVEPMTLLGSELRGGLTLGEKAYSEVRLMSFDSEVIGAVTEVGGKPALVQPVEGDAFKHVDVIFDCGGGQAIATFVDSLPDHTVTILVDPTEIPESATPVVAGVNLAASLENNLLVSPEPSTILMAHLLAPLLDLDVRHVFAHCLLPASAMGQAGLDELFNQTRSILAMNQDRPDTVFGAQLAFNLLPIPWTSDPGQTVLSSILGRTIDGDVVATRAGVFHSLATALIVRFAQPVDSSQIDNRYVNNQYIQMTDDSGSLGPVDAAASDQILLTPAEASSTHREVIRFWAVMDNLTRGGALNALAIADYILTHRN